MSDYRLTRVARESVAIRDAHGSAGIGERSSTASELGDEPCFQPVHPHSAELERYSHRVRRIRLPACHRRADRCPPASECAVPLVIAHAHQLAVLKNSTNFSDTVTDRELPKWPCTYGLSFRMGEGWLAQWAQIAALDALAATQDCFKNQHPMVGALPVMGDS